MNISKSESRTFEYYIFPNKVLFWIIGIWPFDESTTRIERIFAYFRILFTLSCISSLFLPIFLLVIIKWGDIHILAGSGCISTTVGQSLFKMIYFLVKNRKLTKLYNDVKMFWYLYEDFEDKKSYTELANQARIFTIVFFISGICTVYLFIISAGVITIRENHIHNNYTSQNFPFEAWYGQDVLQSPTFEIAFISQIITLSICNCGTCGLDSSMAALTLHICGQFTLIQARFRIIGEKIGHVPLKDARLLENLKLDIQQCIQHHQYAIRTAKEMNILFSPIVFIMLLTSGLEICFTGYAVTNGANRIDLIKFIFYLSSMVVQLMIWCYPGERLILESQEVMKSIYLDIPWYNLPSSYSQDLIIVICKAQRHCCIRAVPFNTLSMSTLTNVFNTAASYFALLRQMQQD